ncbi:MAG TPA: T9SS type B sorting domain-containing protein, partial [Phaeodactylibacter sp.]|nr:T9SS type B sorting domain-containing protein [Phaeodactylibacter sp.]
DGDLFPDYRDWDRDGDGIADNYECPDPTNCIDSDDDGIFDIDELDSDGDGYTDMEECPGGVPCADLDGNMIDDFREINCPDFGVTTLVADDETICEGEVLGISTTAIQGTNVAYEWFYNNGTTNYSLGITNTPNYYINFTNPSHTGAYSVQVRSGICASQMSNAVNINVYSTSPPIATNESTPELPVCEGENVQLNVPYMIDATYEWHGPNGFTSTQYDPVILNATSEDAGSYYAVVTMSGGCATLISTNTTLFVQATPAPAAVQDEVTICEGTDLALTANPIGVPPTTDVSFEWFYQDGTSVGTTDSTTLLLPNIADAAAGNYYVEMTVANCVANTSDMVQVNITPTDTPNAGNDMTVCGLGNAVLNGAMPTVGQGEWTSPTGATIADATNPQTAISNLTFGNNILVWTLSNGNCENYAADTVILDYNDVTNDVAQAGADFGVCDATVADLGGVSPVTAFGLWTQPAAQAQSGVVITNTTAPTPVVEGLEAGNTYTFTWTLSQGTCFNYDSDEVTITVSETPSINAHVEAEQYTCGDNQATILATPPTVGTGQWMTTSAATIVDNQNATTIVDDIGIGASMFVWTLSNGACENYDADTLVVFREEAIEVEDDNYTIRLNEILTDEDVLVNDFIGFVNEYEVNITQQPSMGTVTMNDGIFTYEPRHNAYGIDQFEYEVCNVNCPTECKKATVNIKLNGLNAAGDCWIPNVLTPNGNGKNDALIIPCTENFPNNELSIFNRWGDKIFSTQRYQNDWEGKYKGKDLPAGTYYYIFKTNENDVEPLQGFITILR